MCPALQPPRSTPPDLAAEWLEASLRIADDIRYVFFRPWPMALLAVAQLLAGADPISLRVGIEQTFALSCQFCDPCWDAASACVMVLTFAATDDDDAASAWLIDAGTRCIRISDSYRGLFVRILADRCAVQAAAGRLAESSMLAREMISIAARAHMDGYVHRAMGTITGAGH